MGRELGANRYSMVHHQHRALHMLTAPSFDICKNTYPTRLFYNLVHEPAFKICHTISIVAKFVYVSGYAGAETSAARTRLCQRWHPGRLPRARKGLVVVSVRRHLRASVCYQKATCVARPPGRRPVTRPTVTVQAQAEAPEEWRATGIPAHFRVERQPEASRNRTPQIPWP
jgi:hypothetical protein